MITEREQAKLDKALIELDLDLRHSADKIEDLKREIKEEPLEYWKKEPRAQIRQYQAGIRQTKAIRTLLKENENLGIFCPHLWKVYLSWFDSNVQSYMDDSIYPHPDHVGYPAEHEEQTWGYGE